MEGSYCCCPSGYKAGTRPLIASDLLSSLPRLLLSSHLPQFLSCSSHLLSRPLLSSSSWYPGLHSHPHLSHASPSLGLFFAVSFFSFSFLIFSFFQLIHSPFYQIQQSKTHLEPVRVQPQLVLKISMNAKRLKTHVERDVLIWKDLIVVAVYFFSPLFLLFGSVFLFLLVSFSSISFVVSVCFCCFSPFSLHFFLFPFVFSIVRSIKQRKSLDELEEKEKQRKEQKREKKEKINLDFFLIFLF